MGAGHDSHTIVLLLFAALAEDLSRRSQGTAKRGRMQVWDAWAGLGRSAFIADVGPRDLDPKRLLVTLALGIAVACVAAMAGWILIMAPEAILTGHGGDGLRGLGAAAIPITDFHLGGLWLTVVRLLVATSSDSVFLLAFVAVAAAVAGHDLKRYWTAAPRIRWRLIAGGTVLAMIVLAPAVAAERLLYSGPEPVPLEAVSHHLLGRLAYIVATLLLIPAAAAEELFFRGWLMRQMATLSRRPSLIIGLTALIFSAMHLDFSADGFLTRVLMGAGLGYMTLRLGGSRVRGRGPRGEQHSDPPLPATARPCNEHRTGRPYGRVSVGGLRSNRRLRPDHRSRGADTGAARLAWRSSRRGQRGRGPPRIDGLGGFAGLAFDFGRAHPAL